MSKEQKDFTKSIEKLNSTLDKMDQLSRQAKLDLAEICNNAKQVYIVGPDAIVPLFADDELTPPVPSAEQVHKIPKRSRKKVDLSTAPADDPPAEDPPDQPAENQPESEKNEEDRNEEETT